MCFFQPFLTTGTNCRNKIFGMLGLAVLEDGHTITHQNLYMESSEQVSSCYSSLT